CRIGDVTTVTFEAAALKQAGLSEQRFTKLKARQLTPQGGGAAEVVPILGNNKDPLAVRARRGAGDGDGLALDPSGVDFVDGASARAFWEPFIKSSDETMLYSSATQTDQRAMAVGQVMDLLGDVPGIGTFGFKYVAIVLMAMMVIVGPVDWFVLKWMG